MSQPAGHAITTGGVAGRALRGLGVGIVVASSSAVLGVGFVALAAATHPLVAVLLPLGVAGAVTALDRPWTGLAAVVAAVPLGVAGVQLGPLDPIELLVVLAAGTTVVHRLLQRRTLLPWPSITWWPVAIGCVAVLSATRALDLALAVGQLLLLAVGGLAFLTTVGAVDGSRDVRRVVTAWCVVGAGVGLHALTGAGDLAATSGGLTVAGRPTGVFTSPNQLGAYAGMTLLLALGLLLSDGSRRQRTVAVVAALAATAALGLSLSRGAWVGTGVAGLLFVSVVPAARSLAGRWLVPGLAVIAVLGGLLLPQAPTQVQVVSQRFETLTEGETSPYDNRDAIWAEAIREARERPWLGQGPANFPVVSRRATSESSFAGAEHAHSTPLNTAAEFGIPALLLLGGFTLALLRAARRTVRRLPRSGDAALAAGAGGALLVQVVHGLVDYTLRNATLAVLTWVVAGLVVAIAQSASSTAPPPAGRGPDRPSWLTPSRDAAAPS